MLTEGANKVIRLAVLASTAVVGTGEYLIGYLQGGTSLLPSELEWSAIEPYCECPNDPGEVLLFSPLFQEAMHEAFLAKGNVLDEHDIMLAVLKCDRGAAITALKDLGYSLMELRGRLCRV